MTTAGFSKLTGTQLYQMLPHVVRVAYLAHIRRKFFDVLTENEQERTKKTVCTREQASEEGLFKIDPGKKGAAWIGVE